MVASRSQTISVTERPQAENGIRFPWKWEQGKIVFTGPAKAARKRELLPVGRKGGRRVHVAASSSSSSDEDERETGIRPAPLYPSNDLLDALKYHYLHFFILKRSHRLPYLSRNLRIGFKAYCSRNGITVAPETRSGDPVRLLIRLVEPASSDSEDPDDGNVSRYQAKLMRWKCPLCDTHGLPGFNNKDMLDAHLSWDHSEVSFKWECNENFVDCQLTLSVPDVSDEKTSVGSPSRSPSPEEALATATVEEGIDPSQVSDTRLPHETAEAPMSSSTVKVEWDEPSGSSTIPTLSSQSSSTAPTMSRFATPIRIERETPHPTADPLPSFDIPAPPMGPTAQYPYLPADAYSCRPGGPRLFDLLPPLSRDLYGVMVWAVIDKEEELFELDDVRDEDKVIQALWNRWILLGRYVPGGLLQKGLRDMFPDQETVHQELFQGDHGLCGTEL
ncbi:hypothetical protein FA95DRAFT_1552611 [Auriscalpium vulgare]|uniref:Uncharacterized protein n=1 Tax=Auriscalpium vulgare TaxID=40419 RepID=A0ACB8S927_9AGAM|nr:hypothetical protein FA95DRAFT_1552611 [Auriscalpium vulgare]